MAALKTKATSDNVQQFLNSLENDQKRSDCITLLELLEDITSEKACMWGAAIIGFGRYHYVYDSGREGDWFLTGFAPRKQNITIYLMGGLTEHAHLMEKLGKYKQGKGCIYINKLSDINTTLLRSLCEASVDRLKKLYADHN